MKTDVLGVAFDNLTLTETADLLDGRMKSGQGGYDVTANPEIVLRCREDAAYAAAVNAADCICPDGVGDLYAAKILGTPLRERVTGSDLTPVLLRRLASRAGSVFLYGGKPGVAERAAENIRRQWPTLRLTGTENGYIKDDTELLRRLREERPDLVLVGLGAPKQELWMARHRAELSSLMIGVGGLLDVFAGDAERAPDSWQKLNLEWLYRLYREPWRAGRMAKLPRILLLAARERVNLINDK